MTLLSQVAASLAGASLKALGSAAALTAATIAYLDAKFGISTDISSLRDDKLFVRILQQRYAELGEYCTLYKMLERAVDVKGWGDRDALWFENKTWSYRQLKECMLRALLRQRYNMRMLMHPCSSGSIRRAHP